MSHAAVEYRGIQGFSGYRVGNDGSVWSIWFRQSLGWRHGWKMVIGTEWHQLKPSVQRRNGRILTAFVTLRPGQKQMPVHRLVLEAFVGPRPPRMDGCHFPDRDRMNNRLDNLRWDTRKGNKADELVHGTRSRGERHGNAKLTEDAIVAIRKSYASGGATHKELAEKYGVGPHNIGSIVRGSSWKHVA